MATVNPELSVKIKFDTPTLQSELKAAEGLILKSTEVTEAKLLSSDKLHQQKLAQQKEQAWKRYETQKAIAEQRALDKSLKANSSWSAKMTKNLESLTMTVKGFFAAWATAQATQMIGNSLKLAGGMRELADGIGVTTQEYFALSSAMRDAGASAEKLDPIFTRLNEITSGGADEKQNAVLAKLGIADGTLVSSIELLDKLIKGFNDASVSADDVGKIVGARVVPSFRRLAAEIDSVNAANAKYKFPLTEAEVKQIDEMNAAFSRWSDNVSLFIARVFTSGGLGGGWAAAAKAADDYKRVLEEIDKIQVSVGQSSLLGEMPSLPEQIVRPVRQIGPAQVPPMRYDSRVLGKTFVGATSELTEQDILLSRMSRSMTALMATAGNLPVVYKPFTQEVTASEEKLRAVQQTMSAVQSTIGGVFSMQTMLFQNEIAHLQAIEDRERERWEERSKMLRDAGLESSALYKREQEAYEKAQKDRQKKQTKLQSKAWEQERIARIGNIVMDTAQGIMGAWATTKPTFLAPLITALVSAAGATQLGIVASQQNPYKGFAFGGLVTGRGYADDVPINTTPGEFVSTRESAERNRDALEFGNRGGRISRDGASGVTVVVQGDIIGDQRYVEEKLIPNIQKALNRGHRLKLR